MSSHRSSAPGGPHIVPSSQAHPTVPLTSASSTPTSHPTPSHATNYSGRRSLPPIRQQEEEQQDQEYEPQETNDEHQQHHHDASVSQQEWSHQQQQYHHDDRNYQPQYDQTQPDPQNVQDQEYDNQYVEQSQRYAEPYGDAQNPFEGDQQQEYDAGVVVRQQSLDDVPLQPEPIPDDTYKRSKYYLYISYALSAWGDRMWEFSVIVFLLDLFPNTLLYSSLFGLVEKVVSILAGPSVGRKIDDTDRLVTLRWCIVGQNLSIALASIVFFMGLSKASKGQASSGFLGLCYAFILIMGATAAVAAMGAKVALHKDWIVVLSGGQPKRLTELNSTMRRIDLSCNILAPLLVGIISSTVSNTAAVIFVAIWASVSLFIEFLLVGWVFSHIPQLHGKGLEGIEGSPKPVVTQEVVEGLRDPRRPMDYVAMQSLAFFEQLKIAIVRYIATMKEYKAHPVFLASFAYCLLYVSILSMGGIMTSWLKAQGTSDVVIAIVRAIAALVGIGSTFCLPWMVRRWGLIRAGLISIWAQVICLLPVVFTFVTSSTTGGLVVLFIFLCLSRFGLWSFDLCETQIMQESIAPEQSGVMNGAQESLINVCYIIGFLLTIIFSNPSIFAAPAWISFIFVIVAGLVFTKYASRVLGTENPFPSLESFKLNQPLEYEPAAVNSPGPPQSAIVSEDFVDETVPVEVREDHQQYEQQQYPGGSGHQHHEYRQDEYPTYRE